MSNKQNRFDSLVNALYADVYRYAYWLCKSKVQAEDLVQETYLRAWKNFSNLKDEKSAKAWLFTIVRRENARKYERYQPQLVEIDKLEIKDSSLSPQEHSEQNIIQQHILSLDKDFREPLVLQVMGGFNVNEVSSILGVNKNTVLTRLHRARNKLKIKLSRIVVNEEKGHG